MESIFCLLLVVEAFSLRKALKMVDMVVSWCEVRWTWWIKQNLIIQFLQLLKNLLFDMWLGIVVEKDWAHTVDQWQLQFSVHPINLLNILLRCNSFARIQKAIEDQMSSSPPNSDCDFFFFFFCATSGLEGALELLLQSNHWAGHFQLSYKIHFSLHVTIPQEMVLCYCIE